MAAESSNAAVINVRIFSIDCVRCMHTPYTIDSCQLENDGEICGRELFLSAARLLGEAKKCEQQKQTDDVGYAKATKRVCQV